MATNGGRAGGTREIQREPGDCNYWYAWKEEGRPRLNPKAYECGMIRLQVCLRRSGGQVWCCRARNN